MIAGVLLAAGMSTRMGRNKLLLPVGGRPLAAWGLGALAGAGLDPVVCVLGHEAEAVQRALSSCHPGGRVRFVLNPDYATGRASSVRTALAHLPEECEAAVFLPGDLLGATPEGVRAIVARHRKTGYDLAVAVSAAGDRTHPVLFARKLFAALAALEGDESGQRILLERWDSAEKVPVSGDVPIDVDTPEDYRTLCREAG